MGWGGVGCEVWGSWVMCSCKDSSHDHYVGNTAEMPRFPRRAGGRQSLATAIFSAYERLSSPRM